MSRTCWPNSRSSKSRSRATRRNLGSEKESGWLDASTTRGTFGQVIKGFDRHDAAEALVGSVVFGIPMVIEGGTLQAGEFVATHPLYFLATIAFGISLVVGLLYVAEVQDVRVVDPLFGVLPRRLIGVLLVAAVTATAMMTAWGRVDWATPWLTTSQIVVVSPGWPSAPHSVTSSPGAN